MGWRFDIETKYNAQNFSAIRTQFGKSALLPQITISKKIARTLIVFWGPLIGLRVPTYLVKRVQCIKPKISYTCCGRKCENICNH